MASVLACTGALVAAYLGGYQVGWWNRVWDPLFGEMSARVLHSGLSRTLPIPDAWLGCLAYLLEAGLELVGNANRWRDQPLWTAANMLLVVLMGIGALGLVFIQGTVLRAWCTLCLASAACSLAIVVLSWPEIRAVASALERRVA